MEERRIDRLLGDGLAGDKEAVEWHKKPKTKSFIRAHDLHSAFIPTQRRTAIIRARPEPSQCGIFKRAGACAVWPERRELKVLVMLLWPSLAIANIEKAALAVPTRRLSFEWSWASHAL
jgi:hypothetical protein